MLSVSEGEFDAELYGAGIVLTCFHIEAGMQDFVELAQTIGRDLDMAPIALRRHLRSWYEGARYACLDNDIDVSGCWSEEQISDAMKTIDEWGQGPYSEKPSVASHIGHTEAHVDTEDDLRRLMGIALTTPTPEAVMAFVDFTSKMKRLGPYNMMMVYAQRPGATAVASRHDWEAAGQSVREDAIPILILKPKGPITQVFEFADTEPSQERDPRVDPFAAVGQFDERRLIQLIERLARPTKRKLKVDVRLKDFGAALAGRVVKFGIHGDQTIGNVEAADAHSSIKPLTVSTYAISLNRHLTPVEQFTTLLHELGHLFCGHLGAFDADNPAADEYGWPDRHGLAHAAKEIEAELVAWHIAEREDLVVGSPLYLKFYMEEAAQLVDQVDLDRVIRAIARVRAYLGDPALPKRS